ncbi:MAG: hypothetical protein U0Q18_33360 [Bryobacteraceae bacterium]
MKNLTAEITRLWCRMTHAGPMWPISGEYRCATCLRKYPVSWEVGAERHTATGKSVAAGEWRTVLAR